MKPQFNRARIGAGLGAVALSAGLLAATGSTAQAAADVPHQPSDADFADCPALPQGVLPALWNCVSIVAVGGEMKLGSLKQELTKPVKITVAMGPKDGKLTLVPGPIKADPIGVPPETLPIPLPGLTVKVEQAGDIKPGALLPESIPLKIKLEQLLLGNNCYIGSNAEPISVKPNLSGLKLDTLGGVRVIRATISDTQFAVPAATNCFLATPVINLIAGLPSPSGKNAVTMNTVVRIKNYRLGQITQQAAKQKGVR